MRIGIIGSEKVYSKVTFDVMEHLSKTLNPIHGYFTGGTGGSPYWFVQQFARDITHILPVTKKESKYIETLKVGRITFKGNSMKERRKVLIEQCDLIIMFEGGSGTADESSIALNLNIPVYCFPVTGGASNGLFYVDDSYNKIIKCTLDNYQTILPKQIFNEKLY